LQGEQILVKKSTIVNVIELSQAKFDFVINTPSENGKYSMIAELEYDNEPVKSIREFKVQ